MINPLRTIISQYANSPVILQLLNDWNEALDPAPLLDDFYNKVWNLSTAEGYGLDVWGRIVGVSRLMTILATDVFFGFDEGQLQPFDQAPFYNGADASLSYSLTDQDFRRLILLKAYSNISDCSAEALNRMLVTAFGDRGRVYVERIGPMRINYVFDFQPTALDNAILLQSGAMSRPIGVDVGIRVVVDEIPVVETMFGFDGSDDEPFGQAPMYNGDTDRL